jgi:MFS transporter, ACDE family, multidrug resistance protein
MTATGILANALLLPVLPDLVEAFGQDEAGGGLLLAIGSAPGIALSPLLGTLSDRWGRRTVVVPSLVTFALGAIAMAAAGSWGWLLAARLVQGLGATGLVSLAVVLLGDWYEGPERSSRLAANAAVLTTSGAVAPLLSGLVGERFGPQAPLLLGVVGLPIAWLAARVLPRGPAAEPSRRSRGGLVRHLRGDRLIVPVAMGALLFVVYFGPARAGATFALDQTFGASTSLRGWVLLVASAPSAAVSLALARHPPTRTTPLVAVAFGVFSVGLVVMAGAPVLALFVGGALLTGLAEGAIVPLLQSRISAAARPEHRGAVLATWASGVRIGQSGGPLLTGVVLRSTSPAGLFAGAAAVTSLLAVIALRTPDPPPPSRRTAAPPRPHPSATKEV